jgi:predicted ATPase/transcriptional regulator with XRE-family HTH domain
MPIATFGLVVKRYRVAAGFTQEELAERSGLSVPSISNLERGVLHRPRHETVRLLADALDLQAEERASFFSAARSARGAPADMTPITHEASARSARVVSLPRAPTPLLGREHDLPTVAALLQDGSARLITLTGLGGVGKTRLALEVAWLVANSFANGACFVSLASIRDPDLVPSAIAAALGLHDSGEGSFSDLLLTHMHDKQLLLLLDNVEQVAAAAPFIADVLAGCPALVALITSRISLRLRGEHEYAVPPLAVPDSAGGISLATFAEVGSVRLFTARVREAQPDFALSAVNAPAVASICQRLEGLPLALELAAARYRVLDLQTLAARLETRLPLLTRGAVDLPERQRTLRATLTWSYELLPPAARATFRQLAVFVGGCTLAAAEAVCQAMDRDSPDGVLDLLSILVEHHLLGCSPVAPALPDGPDSMPSALGNGARYTMLETVREYAWEQLQAHSEAATAQEAHLAYFVAVAEAAAPHLRGQDQARWLASLDAERDNLRAALQEAIDLEDAESGLRLGAALMYYWYSRGAAREGRAGLERVLRLGADKAHSLARAGALHSAGVLAFRLGDYDDAARCYEAALALRRTLGDEAGSAVTLNNLGIIAAQRDDYARAVALYEESLGILRKVGNLPAAARTLTGLGIVAFWRGDFAHAQACHEESLAMKRAAGDMLGCAVSLSNLAELAYQQGDLQRAEARCREGLALLHAEGTMAHRSELLDTVGRIALSRKEYINAAEALEESLRLCREADDTFGIAEELASLGELALALREAPLAAERFKESVALYHEIGMRLGLARGLEGMARVAGAQHDMARATQLCGAATAIREAIGAPAPPAQYDARTELRVKALAVLGEEVFASALKAGKASSLDTAIELAMTT